MHVRESTFIDILQASCSAAGQVMVACLEYGAAVLQTSCWAAGWVNAVRIQPAIESSRYLFFCAEESVSHLAAKRRFIRSD